MNATLQAFAAIYRTSTSGRRDAVKDYTIDWEKFLRAAGRDDGEERELAVQELLVAERQSCGLFIIDRHSRTGDKLRLRLKREGGEAWLFAVTGRSSPAADRESLAGFFEQAGGSVVQEALVESWQRWMAGLAARARDGGSVQPFKRDDAGGNTALLDALTGVLNWRDESLIRYASVVICGDSKALEGLRPRLHQALREITGDAHASLDDFGISDAPRSVLVHGPLVLKLGGGVVDLGLLAGPVAVSATDLAAALEVSCGSKVCLTVENEGVFRELAKRRTGMLLVHTSFPGSATRLLFGRLPADLECHHFGDSDPAGFDILRDLREKTGREFQPVMMQFRARPGEPLTEDERKVIGRLLTSDSITDVHGVLRAMLDAGSKGDFEQESVELSRVAKGLRT